MDYLRKYAEASGALGKFAPTADATIPEEDDDEVPELVENFEEAAAK